MRHLFRSPSLIVPLLALVMASAALAAVTTPDPKKLVLRRSDVPAGLRLLYAAARPKSSADIQPPPNSRAWIVGYAKTTPPLTVVASSAYVFTSTSAARTGFARMLTEFANGGVRLYGSRLKTLAVPRLGDEGRGWTLACDGTHCPVGSTQAFLLVRKGGIAWGLEVLRAAARQVVVGELLTLARKQMRLVAGA